MITIVAGPRCRIAITLLAAVSLATCGRPPADTRGAVAYRLIAEPTDEIFDLSSLRKSYGYQRRSFETRDQLRLWRTRDEAEVVIKNRQLVVRPTGEGHGVIRLSHEIELFAEDVRTVVVEARGIRQGSVRLFWAIPGEGYADGRGLSLDAEEGTAPSSESGSTEPALSEPSIYTFKVAEHAAWQGRVWALRLDLPNVAGQDVEIRSVEMRGREGYEAEMLARIVAQDWKVELGHEARNAVLTPPDVPRRWRLPEPVTGKLRFAYGLPRGGGPGRGLMRFKIFGEGAGSQRRQLFEASVDSRNQRAGRWLEGEVDLSSEVSELVFETTAAAGYRFQGGIPAWANPEILTSGGGARRPNVILISVDTLRADHLGAYGYAEPTSPNIDRWARSSSVTFRRAVATAPWTLPSHVSMLSGLDAINHGVNHNLAAPRELELLPEVLRRAGYLTAAVTGGGWLHPDQGLAQGFDVFRYWGRGTAGEKELEAGIERALELLEAGGERELFLFFHTYEAHDPFRRRLPWAERCGEGPEADAGMLYGAVEERRMMSKGFALRYALRKWRPGTQVKNGAPVSDAELPLVSCLYDSGIAYVDQQLGRLFERLGELDPGRRTLVVLTSDHGESLGEYGYVKHAYLFDSNLLVPLIVGLPGGRYGGETIDAQVSSVDIVPTILAAIGLETPGGIDGESLLPLIEGKGRPGPREAWSYAGASNFGLSLRLDNRIKYLYNNTAWRPLGGKQRLYDLRVDTDEQDDLKSSSPERVERLRARSVEYLERHYQGVRIVIENRGCGELQGTLSGLAMHVSRVKATRPPGMRLKWRAKRQGRFHLQPDETLDLLLEAASGTVTIKGKIVPCGESSPASSGEMTFRETLDLDRIDTWELGFDGIAWRRDLEVAGQARIVVRRMGRSVTEQERSDMDPALVEQLKALGYLND